MYSQDNCKHVDLSKFVISEISMDDGRVIRVVQSRLGILRTLVGDCVTLIEVELPSGRIMTATLSLDDSVRKEMQLSKVGSDAVVDWCGSPLTIGPNAMFLLESDGEVFQPFDGIVKLVGL